MPLSQGTLLEDFADRASWTITSGSPTLRDDYSTPQTGQTGPNLLVEAANQSVGIRKAVAYALTGMTNFYLRVWLSTALGGPFRLYLITAANDSAYLWINVSGTTFLHPGWNELMLPRAAFGSVGGAAWTDTAVKLLIQFSSPGAAFDAIFDVFACNYNPALPVILWSIDDSKLSMYTLAFPEFTARGIPFSAFTVGSWVGANPALYVSLAQLLEIQAAGNTVANHTLAHTTLSGLTAQQQANAISRGASWLVQNGFTGDKFFTPPGGACDDTTRWIARSLGIRLMRLSNGRLNQAHPRPDGYSELYLPTRTFGSSVSAAAITGEIDQVIAGGGVYCPGVHNVVASGATGDDINVATLQAVLDYAQAKEAAGLLRNLNFENYWAWLDRLQGTAPGGRRTRLQSMGA
jgi:peptidoglycan/xylan/chitin deacetylase (PgdA/CDA1 family)